MKKSAMRMFAVVSLSLSSLAGIQMAQASEAPQLERFCGYEVTESGGEFAVICDAAPYDLVVQGYAECFDYQGNSRELKTGWMFVAEGETHMSKHHCGEFEKLRTVDVAYQPA